jgi:hypothetical protein
MPSDAIYDFGFADDSAAFDKSRIRQFNSHLRDNPIVTFAVKRLARVHEKLPAKRRGPGSILHVLEAVHDQPSPRLPDAQSFHMPS